MAEETKATAVAEKPAEEKAKRPSRAYVKPSREYIEDSLTELQGLYAGQDDQIKRMRAVREQVQPVNLSQELRLVSVEVQDPTATDEIARASASMAVNDPKCHVTPSRPSDKAQENATKREKGSESIFRVCGRRTPGRDTFSEIVDHAVGDGGAWAKLVWQKDSWDERYKLKLGDYEREALDELTDEDRRKEMDDDEADEFADAIEGDEDKETKVSKRRQELDGEPIEIKSKRLGGKRYKDATEEAKKEAGPPFLWTAVDPLSIYPVWAANKLTEVFEVTERPQLATFRKWRLRRNTDGDIVPDELGQGTPVGDGKTTGSTLRFVEHWDARMVSYLVIGKNNKGDRTGQIVQQWEHHYGRVPYFYAPGITMAHWKNRKVGWGVSEAKRWLVEYRSFLWTLHANVAARDAFTPLQKKRPALAPGTKNEPGVPAQKVHWGLREIIETDPGGELEPIQFPEVLNALKEQIGIVSDAIEKLESPRVTSEIGGGLEGAGFAINQVLAEAKIRFDPIARGIERMYEEATRFLWHLIKKIVRETVWVYREGKDTGYLALAPEDVQDVVGLRWELDPERPSAKLIEARYWHERVKSGSASMDQAIEAMGDNPDEVRLGRSMDRIRASEWYQKYQDMMVLQQVAKGDLMLFAQRAQFVAQQGGMPGTVPNAMGNSIVPDMGALAQSPGGAGAAPMGPPNGAVSGAGPGAVVPQAGAAAGIQQLQG